MYKYGNNKSVEIEVNPILTEESTKILQGKNYSKIHFNKIHLIS